MQGVRRKQKCRESTQWILRQRTLSSRISSRKRVRISLKRLDDEATGDDDDNERLIDYFRHKTKAVAAEARNSPYRLRPRASSSDCISGRKKRRIISQKSETPSPPHHSVEAKLKNIGRRGPLDRPVTDGYNWRKYGRKHIRVFGKVRNYYKCTHPSCPMRKNVDESLKERLKHTIYIGEHNHEKPQRLRVCWTYLINKFSCGNVDANAPKSIGPSPFQQDPSTHLQLQKKTCNINSLVGEGGMQVSSQVACMSKEIMGVDALVPLSSEDGELIMRQTRGFKDHKDGYSWHKYGEKVIKGDPHLRSYYKCSFVGCPMRKQINQSIKGSTGLIITYHGEHLHELPAFRSL